MWHSHHFLRLVHLYIDIRPALFEALGQVASCSRHCGVVKQRMWWVENGILCSTSVRILVPVMALPKYSTTYL